MLGRHTCPSSLHKVSSLVQSIPTPTILNWGGTLPLLRGKQTFRFARYITWPNFRPIYTSYDGLSLKDILL